MVIVAQGGGGGGPQRAENFTFVCVPCYANVILFIIHSDTDSDYSLVYISSFIKLVFFVLMARLVL
jgi:hypothetical protein